jgi:hypothetical protein
MQSFPNINVWRVSDDKTVIDEHRHTGEIQSAAISTVTCE